MYLPVLVFSVGSALQTGLLFGLWPASRLSRRCRPSDAVGFASSRRTARRQSHEQQLIAGQIALTLLILAGAGAAIQGFLRTMSRPLGYDPHDVMSVIPIHDGTYRTWGQRAAYFNQLQKKVVTVPGVTIRPFRATPRRRTMDLKRVSISRRTGPGRPEGPSELRKSFLLPGVAYSVGAGAHLGRDGEPQRARILAVIDHGAPILPQWRCDRALAARGAPEPATLISSATRNGRLRISAWRRTNSMTV